MDDKLKSLKSVRARKLGNLTRIRRRAFIVMDSKGSRTQLTDMLKELDVALEAIQEVHDQYVACLQEEAELMAAEVYIADVDKQHAEAVTRIEVHLNARKDEAPSHITSAASRASVQTAVSEKAKIAVRVKQLEVTQLEHRLELEKQEQDMRRRRQLQEARDAKAAAELEAQLVMAAEGDLSWERRNDFVGEPEAQGSAVSPRPIHDVGKPQARGSAVLPRPIHDCQSQTQPLFHRSLPRLTLPKFDGNSGDWVKWFALFRTLVHDQQELTPTEKMAHLQPAVTGLAQRTIGGMLYRGELYEKAVGVLKDRFGREDDIIHSNLDNIFSCLPPSHLDPVSLEKFQATVHCAVAVFQSLGHDGDLYSYENLRRIVEKLPTELKKEWGEHILDLEPQKPSLIHLDSWLCRQVRIALNYAAVSQQPGRQSVGRKSVEARKQSGVKEQTVQRTALATEAQNTAGKVCICCEAPHDVTACPTFLNKTVDEKAQFVASSGSCFFCLRKGHAVRNCRFARQCGISGCKMRHHKMLHGSERISTRVKDSERRVVATVTESDQTEGVTLLQIVPVRVHTQDGQYRDTLAMLDPGSQTSLCSEAIIRDAKLSGETHQLCIENVEGRGKSRMSTKDQLHLSPLCDGEDASRMILVPEAFSVPLVNGRVQHIPKRRKNTWKHLQGLPIPDCTHGTVEILLGANVLEAVLQQEARVGRAGEPVAVRTAFGWTLTGTIAGFVPPQARQVMFIHRGEAGSIELAEHVHDWWKTESFGTRCDVQVETSAEDLRALRLLDSSVRKCEDRYEAGLLWKSDEVTMPDNKPSAMARPKSLERSLLRSPEKAAAYSAAIQSYVETGHARKLSQEEAAKPDNKLWLLPHHAVLNANKPKLRVVFDAAATHHDVSLNSQLIKGPDLLQNLVGILLRFRQEKVAIVGDITQMFHQIRIREEDQPALSFWWRNLDQTREPDMHRMQVAIFGAKCSPAIANYVLQKTAEDGCTETVVSQNAKKAVKTSFYMDDFVKSTESVEAACVMRREITSLLAKGGFHLTKWVSNDAQVLSDVSEEENGTLKPDSTFPGKFCYSVLGCKWTPLDDTLSVKLNPISVPSTKRGVLKQVASLYDPLGMLAPYTLLAKKLIQDLWRKKLDWDDQLTGEDLHVWRSWLKDLRHVEEARIPRWYRDLGQESRAETELHLFSDASEHSFGTVAYVRVLSPGSRYCQFMMARTRLAPLRQLSIVRLELQGAVLSTRVADMIKKERVYDFTRTIFWTDSRVVLQFLKNESRRYHTFVANRVSEIHETTSTDQWRHVPGTQNPADHCSRGKPLAELMGLKEWWQGPAFLENSEEFWPQQKDLGEISPNCVEVKRSAVICTVSHTDSSQLNVASPLSRLIDPARFSSWLRHRRIIAWIKRFISNVKCRVAGAAGTSGPLRSEEIVSAETTILRDYQNVHLDAKCLTHLSPFRDEQGLVRVGGRLSKDPLAESTRHPVILLANGDITRMIIADAHQRVLHSGLEMTLCELRKNYWIQKMRSAIKKQLYRCAFCRNRRASPQPPRMADLPAARFDTRRPFSTVGLDYVGPLTVKKFRKTEKRYVLLITCLATRAMHLEIAVSMDTSCFIMALRRFIARRGKPRTIYSDNGTNLVGGERELREAIEHWNQAQITDALSQRNIEWVFIPPAAPHMGGAWERLVASVKRALRVVLGNQCVSEDILQTALAEVEFMINGRPLTYVSNDPQDAEPLTPNHFLLGASDGSEGLPPGVFNDRDTVGQKRWRQAQIVADHLWKRWRQEYLPSLAARQKWKAESRNLQVEDVVILIDDNSPRGYWPLGRVTQVFPGSDGSQVSGS